MWKGGISDWVDGHIDEVRISNGALPPQKFLGSPIPEPGTVFLILSFIILIYCFRKKKLSIKSVSAIMSFILIFAISSHATTNISWGPLTHVVNGGYSRMADLSDGSLLFASERNAGVNNELFGLRSYGRWHKLDRRNKSFGSKNHSRFCKLISATITKRKNFVFMQKSYL